MACEGGIGELDQAGYLLAAPMGECCKPGRFDGGEFDFGDGDISYWLGKPVDLEGSLQMGEEVARLFDPVVVCMRPEGVELLLGDGDFGLAAFETGALLDGEVVVCIGAAQAHGTSASCGHVALLDPGFADGVGLWPVAMHEKASFNFCSHGVRIVAQGGARRRGVIVRVGWNAVAGGCGFVR